MRDMERPLSERVNSLLTLVNDIKEEILMTTSKELLPLKTMLALTSNELRA